MSARQDGWRARALSAEARLAQLEVPEINNFVEGMIREATHARGRWGVEHDMNKTPEDWLWLIAYLATKAATAARYGDAEKYKHHLVTAAGALMNWHAHAAGK